MSFDGRTRRNPLGYQQLSVSTAASLTVPAGADFATIRCSTANTRWRDDGSAPTASVGVPLNAGEVLSYDGKLGAIQFIAQSGTATLDISYYN